MRLKTTKYHIFQNTNSKMGRSTTIFFDNFYSFKTCYHFYDTALPQLKLK